MKIYFLSLDLFIDRVGEVLLGFHGVAFIPSKASFSSMFLKNNSSGESLVTTTCLKTVVGVIKGMLPAKYFYSNKASFCVI